MSTQCSFFPRLTDPQAHYLTVRSTNYFRSHKVGPLIGTRAFNSTLQFWSLSWTPMEERMFADSVRYLFPGDADICVSHGDLDLDNIVVAGQSGL